MEEIRCAFCGRTPAQVGLAFVSGPPGIYICEECVQDCVESLEDEHHDTKLKMSLTNMLWGRIMQRLHFQ